MKIKSLLLLTGILAVLLIGVALTIAIAQFSQKNTTSDYQNSLKSLSLQTVNHIRFSQDEKTISLTLENSQWKLGGKLASRTKVEGFLRPLLTKDAVEQVAQTNKRHEEFNLSEKSAKKIDLNNNVHILLGKNSVDGAYIRFADNDSVYLIKHLSSLDASLEPQDWYDKQIVTIDVKGIKKLSFDSAQRTMSVIKKNDTWVDEKEGREIDKEKVDRVLNKLANLEGESVVDDLTTLESLTTPEFTLTIEHDKTGDTLSFYSSNDKYFVKRNNTDVFSINKEVADSLNLNSS